MWSPRWPENPVCAHRIVPKEEVVVLGGRLPDMEELELEQVRVQEWQLLDKRLGGINKQRAVHSSKVL